MRSAFVRAAHLQVAFGVLLAAGACIVPTASAATLRAPALEAPAPGAELESTPAFSWHAVRNAARYDFELAADRRFGSIVGGRTVGALKTRNTAAAITKSLPDGVYFWRVRAIDREGRAGRWSSVRSWTKAWRTTPKLVAPRAEHTLAWPADPLVLEWTAVPRATRYLVDVATDPTLGNLAAGRSIETQGTVLAYPTALAPGRYFWAVTPIDAAGHRGRRSSVASFTWVWPSSTATRVADVNPAPEVDDPELSWNLVPGAARYEVEVSTSADFAVGSKVCCSELSIATALAPLQQLANNRYFWRVRAVDADGNSGVWNVGAPFQKAFDQVEGKPSIPNLQLRDNTGATLALPATTSQPIVTWDPVPGAASYNLQGLPYKDGHCVETPIVWEHLTATTAWTPLAPETVAPVIGPEHWPRATTDAQQGPSPGGTYCVRVIARADKDPKNQPVTSAPTWLGGAAKPAFTYVPAADSVPSPGERCMGTAPGPLTAGHYLTPQHGSLTPRMPLFTWQPVANAPRYFVVVARDPLFTNIVDIAMTRAPNYAPRLRLTPRTYADETSALYWMVTPARCSDGQQAMSTDPAVNSARSFEKRSAPPLQQAPAAAAVVTTHPTFRWGAAEGAKAYQVEVFQDGGALVDTALTASTSYSALKTYPADTVLYWRVRAIDETGIGLTWSPVQTFSRRLVVPTAAADNPAGGETIPVLRWSPVDGAISYGLHVQQADGTTRDFVVRSAAFTPTLFYGVGIWRWQVRANFPTQNRGVLVSSGYSGLTDYSRLLNAPTGAWAKRTKTRVLFSWDPQRAAKTYRLETARTDSFDDLIETQTLEGTAWAPLLTQRGYAAGGRIYWRVAAVDEGRNVGAFETSSILLPKGFRIRLEGRLQVQSLRAVTVVVTDADGRVVRGATVRARGAGVRRVTRRTDRTGRATFRLRPRRRGTVSFEVSRKGFRVELMKSDVL